MTSLDEDLGRALATLEAEGLLRAPRTITGPQGPEVEIAGRLVACFSSNDYLGLAADPRLREAVAAGLLRYGAGAGASRLITGTMTPHREAEARLAAFVGQPAALLFGSGYAANVGLLSALLGPGDAVFSDALCHASIIDGCRLSRARVHVYAHRDAEALERLLAAERGRARRAVVVTDGVFSMDGVRAPLAALRAACDAHDALLFVDEAHALGVVGPRGAGACAEAGVRPDALVGTLGKAFGLSGAFAAGSATLARFLENRARSYVFSTALPPAIAAAVATATELVAGADDLRATLRRHASALHEGLASQGWDVRGDGTAIVPVVLGDAGETMRLSEALFAAGHLAHGVRPPTVPPGTSRIRLVPTAAHHARHVQRLLEAFARLA